MYLPGLLGSAENGGDGDKRTIMIFFGPQDLECQVRDYTKAVGPLNQTILKTFLSATKSRYAKTNSSYKAILTFNTGFILLETIVRLYLTVKIAFISDLQDKGPRARLPLLSNPAPDYGLVAGLPYETYEDLVADLNTFARANSFCFSVRRRKPRKGKLTRVDLYCNRARYLVSRGYGLRTTTTYKTEECT